MKLLTFTLGLLAFTTLQAQTTMCFKENHTNMMTIEDVKLAGGECQGTKSAKEMKTNGWKIDDIKINGNDYIYIFKKEATNLASLDESALKAKILETIKQKEIEDKAIALYKLKERMSKNGKALYINKCQQCHGEKADKRAYATSRPLIDLTLDDMQISIRDYVNEEYDRGNAFIMKPYANLLTVDRVKDVYSYIKSLKPKKDEAKK